MPRWGNDYVTHSDRLDALLSSLHGEDCIVPPFGSPTNDGHLTIRYKGKRTLVHRKAFELVNGPLKPNQRVLHTCDNPPCSNLDHLYAGTDKDNCRDRDTRGRNGGRKIRGRHNPNFKHGRFAMYLTDEQKAERAQAEAEAASEAPASE